MESRLEHFSFNMTHFASSVCRLVRRSPQGVMGLRTRISTRPGGRLRWPAGFVFGGVWRRYTACPMPRIAQRAVPCQTTRQKQTKWVILKEMCFKHSGSCASGQVTIICCQSHPSPFSDPRPHYTLTRLYFSLGGSLLLNGLSVVVVPGKGAKRC